VRKEILLTFHTRVAYIFRLLTHYENSFKSMDQKTPQNPSIGMSTPIQYTNAGTDSIHHPKRQAIGLRTFAHVRHKILIAYNGRPTFTPTLLRSVGRSPTPTTCLILWTRRSTNPNGIQIQSSVFSQSTGQTDGRTDEPTDGLGEKSLRSIDCSATRLIIFAFPRAAADVLRRRRCISVRANVAFYYSTALWRALSRQRRR